MRKGNNADIEGEILGYMPDAFVMVYYRLVTRSLKQGKDSLAGAGEGGGGGTRGSEGAILLSEDALSRKRRIDRVLRQLARESKLEASKDTPKCTLCGRFVQVDWTYCPKCGVEEPTRKRDVQEDIRDDVRVAQKRWGGVRLR